MPLNRFKTNIASYNKLQMRVFLVFFFFGVFLFVVCVVVVVFSEGKEKS